MCTRTRRLAAPVLGPICRKGKALSSARGMQLGVPYWSPAHLCLVPSTGHVSLSGFTQLARPVLRCGRPHHPYPATCSPTSSTPSQIPCLDSPSCYRQGAHTGVIEPGHTATGHRLDATAPLTAHDRVCRACGAAPRRASPLCGRSAPSHWASSTRCGTAHRGAWSPCTRRSRGGWLGRRGNGVRVVKGCHLPLHALVARPSGWRRARTAERGNR